MPPAAPKLAWMPASQARPRQETLLRRHLRYCLRASPFYRRKLGDIDPDDITLDNLHRLPLTAKAEFADHNAEFRAVPDRRVRDIVFSSGTTGEPTPVIYTERDLDRLARNEAWSFAACGVRPGDVALLTCTLDRCFIAGYAYYSGLRRLGAACIRHGVGSLDSHGDVIRRLRPTVVVGVPSFLLRLGRHLAERREGAAGLSVRRLVCIGEPLRDANLAPFAATRKLEEVWQAHAHSTYASSECVSTFCECEARQGGHLHRELAVLEIVDAQGCPAPPGALGEVVLTPLGVEGMPLVRFRTGDLSFRIDAACACGRRSPRLGPIVGRTAQMIKYRGTTLYPQAIFTALDECPGVGHYFVTVASHTALSDRITVTVSQRDAAWTAARIQAHLGDRLRAQPAVRICPEAQVMRVVFDSAARKPVRFFDRRPAAVGMES